MSALAGLFSFDGRSRRSEWWLTNIGVAMLSGLFLVVVSLAVSGRDFEVLADAAPKPPAVVALNLAVGALVFWIQTAVGLRRSHDRGQSGIGLILYQVIGYGSSYLPLVIQLTNFELPYIPFGGAFLIAFAILYLICGLYFLITLGFLDGQPTANAYGPSPKALQNRNYAAPAIGD